MALFNAPDLVSHHQVCAVSAAVEMKRKLCDLNVAWSEQKLPLIQIRTGINTAMCLVGNVGSEQRMNYTALGDGVNIASRCESLNKRYGTDIIITESTYSSVNHKFLCRWLSYVCLQGKTNPIHVYEVLCPLDEATDEQIRLCSLHGDIKYAIEKCDVTRAKHTCAELLQIDPHNISARELLDRLEEANGNSTADSFILQMCPK
jgi:hypothetical protein